MNFGYKYCNILNTFLVKKFQIESMSFICEFIRELVTEIGWIQNVYKPLFNPKVIHNFFAQQKTDTE